MEQTATTRVLHWATYEAAPFISERTVQFGARILKVYFTMRSEEIMRPPRDCKVNILEQPNATESVLTSFTKL
jgi:hypothetical protein